MIPCLFFRCCGWQTVHVFAKGLSILPDVCGHSANVRQDGTDFRRKPGAFLPPPPPHLQRLADISNKPWSPAAPSTASAGMWLPSMSVLPHQPRPWPNATA